MFGEKHDQNEKLGSVLKEELSNLGYIIMGEGVTDSSLELDDPKASLRNYILFAHLYKKASIANPGNSELLEKLDINNGNVITCLLEQDEKPKVKFLRSAWNKLKSGKTTLEKAVLKLRKDFFLKLDYWSIYLKYCPNDSYEADMNQLLSISDEDAALLCFEKVHECDDQDIKDAFHAITQTSRQFEMLKRISSKVK